MLIQNAKVLLRDSSAAVRSLCKGVIYVVKQTRIRKVQGRRHQLESLKQQVRSLALVDQQGEPLQYTTAQHPPQKHV